MSDLVALDLDDEWDKCSLCGHTGPDVEEVGIHDKDTPPFCMCDACMLEEHWERLQEMPDED